MSLFGIKSKKSLIDQAKENLLNRPKKVAEKLIELVDEDLLKNSEKGYGYGSIYHQQYSVKVDKEVLDIMKEHYEEKGFEVTIDYPSNVENNNRKTFLIRCD